MLTAFAVILSAGGEPSPDENQAWRAAAEAGEPLEGREVVGGEE